jgi:hypothetical protein
MISRQTEIDEEIRAAQPSEEVLDESERVHHDSLVRQLERSERGFREGRSTTWEEVKRRNGL